MGGGIGGGVFLISCPVYEVKCILWKRDLLTHAYLREVAKGGVFDKVRECESDSGKGQARDRVKGWQTGRQTDRQTADGKTESMHARRTVVYVSGCCCCCCCGAHTRVLRTGITTKANTEEHGGTRRRCRGRQPYTPATALPMVYQCHVQTRLSPRGCASVNGAPLVAPSPPPSRVR